jgi:NADH dehydrogenase [ubiquinone] 1 alpha subcomplex assembly factor 5
MQHQRTTRAFGVHRLRTKSLSSPRHASTRARPQRVFDPNVKILHRDHSARAGQTRGFDHTDYLRDAVAANLVDRLPDITVPLPDALDLGCGSGSISRSLADYARTAGQLPAGLERLILVDSSQEFMDVAKAQHCPDGLSVVGSHVCALDEVCPQHQAPESVDLVLSSLSMHWINDLQAGLAGVHNVLRPDGAFIGALFGDETLFELRTSLAIAEQEREGGISPHVSPMLPSSDACALMQAAKFTMPTVDTMKVQVDFDDAFAVMESLSLMGESNAVLGRRNHVSRHTMLAAATIYQELFGNDDGTVPATFEVRCACCLDSIAQAQRPAVARC